MKISYIALLAFLVGSAQAGDWASDFMHPASHTHAHERAQCEKRCWTALGDCWAYALPNLSTSSLQTVLLAECVGLFQTCMRRC